MPDRGRADPVSVEADLGPPAGTEYLPDQHAIRYVARVRAEDEDPPERESAYETRPFEDWARTECARLGRDRVREVVEPRLGSDRTASFAWGRLPECDWNDDAHDPDLAVAVDVRTVRDREGNVVADPDVEYDELLDATPESVTATIRFAEKVATVTFPVVVDESEGQLL